MKQFSYKLSAAAGIVCLSLVACADLSAAQPATRIKGEITGENTFALSGNVHPNIAALQPAGSVEASLPLPRITLHFSMTAAQQRTVQQLLKEQQTPGSPQFRKWLTPEQYGEKFGLNDADLQKISSWLQSQGFTQIEVARSRNAISFAGTAGQAEAAFQTSIQHYNLNGEAHFANASDPQLPRALNGVVESIRGLNDLRPKPKSVRSAVAQPRLTSAITGNHFLTPDDFATIYGIQSLYGAGIDGTGQKIAISGQYDFKGDFSDINAFRSAAGLPANDPQPVAVPGSTAGTDSGDQGESNLDIEWAGGVAKNATIMYVYAADAFTAATYAIQNNVAPVVVLTYGNCEAQTGTAEINSMNAVFQQGNAQGITISVASGDDGAADCDEPLNPNSNGKSVANKGLAVDFPASSPYVTGVGGTELNDCTGSYWNTTNNSYGGSVTGYIPEATWNDTSAAVLSVSCGSAAGVLSASGGGASTFNTKPSWQTGPGVPQDGFRDVPDVAFTASPQHDGYLNCTADSCVDGFRGAPSASGQHDGTFSVVGGTSASAPSFAAIVALLNQYLQSSQGNINQRLYSLASYSSDAFHDITSGTNQVPCTLNSPNCPTSGIMGFSAGAGYDQVTGLGSLNAYNVAREWSSGFTAAINPGSVSIAPGASGTAAIQITPVGNFSGTVSFTCAVTATLTNVTCSVPGTVSSSGTATVTVTAGANASTPFAITHPRSLPPPAIFALSMVLICAAALWMFVPRRHWRLVSLAAGVACLPVLMTSCGSGSSSGSTSSIQSGITTPESGTVTVTATSGTDSHSVTLSVSVT